MKSAVLFVTLVLVLNLCLVRADPNFDDDWKTYKKRFNKTYSSDHEPKRRKNFENKLKLIKKHNEEAAANKHTYQMGLNDLSDSDLDDLNGRLLGFDPSAHNQTAELGTHSKRPVQDRQLPATIDWRGYCIPAVRDQGSCNACYAFAATSALEFELCAYRGGQFTALSEQHLIDCSGQSGCTSGHYATSWNFVYNAPGQVGRAYYPYKAAQGTCLYRSGYYLDVPTGYYGVSESNMAWEIATFGPVAVGFQAVSTLFNYQSGVYSDASCDKTCTKANHAFTVVGYGTENNVPYWLFRNSWGTSWGISGYAKVRRGVNMCNIGCWAQRVYVGNRF